MLSFICSDCKTTEFEDAEDKRTSHANCKGGTWCDCQHRVREKK